MATEDCDAIYSSARSVCTEEVAPCLLTAADETGTLNCFCPGTTAYSWYSCESASMGDCWTEMFTGPQTIFPSIYASDCALYTPGTPAATTSSIAPPTTTVAFTPTPTTPPPAPTTPAPQTTTTSSDSPSPTTSTTPESSPTNTPSPSQPRSVPLTTTSVPIVTRSETPSTMMTSSTHTPVPRYSGTGDLLTGYCATPDYTLVDGGATVYYAPFVGCVGDKLDCCPYVPATTINTATVTTPITITQTVDITASTNNAGDAFPQAADANQATLAKCADDYYSTDGGCCPTGYFPWTALLGGETPCFSTVPFQLTPPPLTVGASGSTGSSKPTVAVVNVIYAIKYPVRDQAPPQLGTAAIAGISVGSVVGGLALLGVAALLVLRRRDRAQISQLSSHLSTSGVASPSNGRGRSELSQSPVPAPSLVGTGGYRGWGPPPEHGPEVYYPAPVAQVHPQVYQDRFGWPAGHGQQDPTPQMNELSEAAMRYEMPPEPARTWNGR